MTPININHSNRVNVQKVAEAVNRSGTVKPKGFVRELRDAGMVVLNNNNHGCVQVLNPDSGMKGHVNMNGEGLNKAYRLKLAHTLGLALRRETD